MSITVQKSQLKILIFFAERAFERAKRAKASGASFAKICLREAGKFACIYLVSIEKSIRLRDVCKRSEGGKVRQIGQRAENKGRLRSLHHSWFTKHKQRWRNLLSWNWSFTACILHWKPLFVCNDLAASSMYIVICYLNAVWCIWTNFCDVLFMNRLLASQSKATCQSHHHTNSHNQLFTWTLTCFTHWSDLMDWFLW